MQNYRTTLRKIRKDKELYSHKLKLFSDFTTQKNVTIYYEFLNISNQTHALHIQLEPHNHYMEG